MATKFHERNQAIFMALQSASGSANKVSTGSLGTTTAIACTAVTGDPTRETGSYQYLGDSLSRDEYTFEKDEYIDLQVDTFQQVLGTLGTNLNPDTASIWKLFQICGGAVMVQGLAHVAVTNSTDSPDYGTVDFRKSSPDDATNDKLYKFWDLRGTVDVTASVGEVPSLKFALKGNADDPVAATKQVADFGSQVTKVASSCLPASLLHTQIIEIPQSESFGSDLTTTASVAHIESHCILTAGTSLGTVGDLTRVRLSGASLASVNGDFTARITGTGTTAEFFVKGLTGTTSGGSAITVKKSTTASKSFCFSTLTAPNFFGFDFQRYTTGCDQGFAKGAVPTDVTVSMLEDQVDAAGVFLPDVNTTKFFSLLVTIGTATTGTQVTYMWDKVQLANVKQGKIATYLARDCTFRNTGSSHIIYN